MGIGDYFQPIAREVFVETLRELGATEVPAKSPHDEMSLLVRFEADDWRVDILALPEDGPKYCPRVEIGPLPQRRGDPADYAVDILHTLPEGSQYDRYHVHWLYSDSAGMKDAFLRVRDEIFRPWAIPVLLNKSQLIALVEARSATRIARWQDQIASHNASICHQRAETAFKSKDFTEYLAQMKEIPAGKLTKVDLARIEFAQKRKDL